MPQPRDSAPSPPKASRRRRGEPRRLLIEAASDLFATQGYEGTSTREIADRAAVSETLMFRYFGSKVGLLRESLIAPFVEFVNAFAERWRTADVGHDDVEELSRQFLGELYDLFRKNRGIVVMMWATDAHSNGELATTGVFDEVGQSLQVLVDLGRAAQSRFGFSVANQDLATRATIAMVAGMAVFGESFYGARRPSRKDIVEEMVQAVVHGHMHRPDPER